MTKITHLRDGFHSGNVGFVDRLSHPARRQLGTSEALFQAHSFHHRLRRDESYSEKWDYVRMNPVRAGLVSDPDQWTYQGVLNELPWWN